MKKLVGSKRGSHVGVIASFGIFIFFLVGLYFVFEPALKIQRSKQGILESVEQDLENKLSSELTTVIINPGGNCSTLSNSIANVSETVYSIVKEQDQGIVGADFSGQNLIIDARNEPLWVYFSDIQFNGNPGSGSGCTAPEIKSVRKSQEIFEKKIIESVVNFTSFKANISIPPGSDFSFSFTFANGTTISAGEKNVSQEVYGNEIPIQYIDSKANNLGGKLTIKVWTY